MKENKKKKRKRTEKATNKLLPKTDRVKKTEREPSGGEYRFWFCGELFEDEYMEEELVVKLLNRVSVGPENNKKGINKREKKKH